MQALLPLSASAARKPVAVVAPPSKSQSGSSVPPHVSKYHPRWPQSLEREGRRSGSSSLSPPGKSPAAVNQTSAVEGILNRLCVHRRCSRPQEQRGQLPSLQLNMMRYSCWNRRPNPAEFHELERNSRYDLVQVFQEL